MKEYMEKYKSRFLWIGLFVFLIHSAKLNSVIIGIDSVDLIQYQNEFYAGWLSTGRYGLVFLKKLLGNLLYNPYFAGLLTLLCFGGAVCAFLMLWWSASESGWKATAAWLGCSLLWISHPIMVEQFYFTLQSAEVCIAMILTAVSLYLTQSWERGLLQYGVKAGCRQWYLPLAGVLILLVTFAVYQVMVVFYIFGAVTLVLLEGLRDLLKQERVKTAGLWLRILPYVAVFLMGFLGNTLINDCFFSDSAYLENQIQWEQGRIAESFQLIAGHIIKTLIGYDGIFYHKSYGFLCALALVLMLWLLIRRRRKAAQIATMLFLLVALFSTPYLMSFVIGGAPVVRSQLILPVATGFMAYLVVILWQETGLKGYVRAMLLGVILIVCVAGVWKQTQITLQLYYTDRMCHEEDVAIARELINRLGDRYEDERMPIVVVGSKPFVGNNACLDGEMTGVSFFEHDAEVEPRFYWSTRRVLGLFHLLGAEHDIAPMERFESAIEYSENMDAWPDKDCIDEYEGVVIIKMSEAD